MGFNFIGGGSDQVFLVPPDARDWLPKRHLAWQVLQVAQELDLAPFLGAYRADGSGRPAYHPAAMLALVMYCYCKGIRSSRAIEMACYDDVGARVIMGNLQPDHATVARFVLRHEQPIRQLLVQSLVVCARDGLVSVEVVASDGTKVKANASKSANATAGQLDLQIGELQKLIDAEVGEWFDQAHAEDAAEQALFGEDGPPAGGPGTLARTVEKMLRRQQAKAKLDAEADQRRRAAEEIRASRAANWAERVTERERRLAEARATVQAQNDRWHAAAAEKPRAGTRPVPVEEHNRVRQAEARLANARARQERAATAAPARSEPTKPSVANTTDPRSRLVPGKQGGHLQGHNVQVTATAEQIVIGISIHNSPNDLDALHPNLRRARANLDAAGIDEPIGAALFDAGYASDDNFTADLPDQATTLYVALGDKTSAERTSHQSRRDMAERLNTDHGRALYKRRGAIVEPVFAQLFNLFGRDLHYRGTRTDTELSLWATTHNLRKLFRNRLQTQIA